MDPPSLSLLRQARIDTNPLLDHFKCRLFSFVSIRVYRRLLGASAAEWIRPRGETRFVMANRRCVCVAENFLVRSTNLACVFRMLAAYFSYVLSAHLRCLS